MPDKENYGETFKAVRSSKNFNQSKVHAEIMHQTSYSKFELGKIEITFNKFEKLLENIEMNFDEFSFIHHSYSYSPRNSIITDFNNLKFIDEVVIQELVSKATAYLKNHKDHQIEDILNVLHALLSIKRDNNFQKAKFYAEKVWQRLQNLNTWYFSEIRLVNNILFLFPIETAITIAKFAIEQGNKYEKHIQYKPLILPFKYNLVHLLMREGYLENAYKINEEIIQDFKKQKSYVQIALCYIRKGCLEKQLDIFSEKDYIQQAYSIADTLEDENLKRQLQSEADYLSNLFSTVPVIETKQ